FIGDFMQRTVAEFAPTAARDVIKSVEAAKFSDRDLNRLRRVAGQTSIAVQRAGRCAERCEGGAGAVCIASGHDYAARTSRKERMGGRPSQTGRATDDHP